MAKNKTGVSALANAFGGLLGKAVKAKKTRRDKQGSAICKSRGLGYDPSTGKCK